ncbi:type II toxin-antitoxin system VapC family toxin [Phytoactinopolyspora limicola]|uniref:type II toxin-antitoxin system VapC family toxin n=1 Tax=Phytoactinopolyspora limicola TaxID=2715536 RepID=UPI00140CDDA9|nr:type II toxin-antitoxin system VapC family toxin [Phytoactinopolyspora limicola]
MRILLDTHVLLWWFTDDDRLSGTARRVIADPANDVFVSAASAWEIATKQRIGKLGAIPQAAERFTELVAADQFEHLPISHLHSLRAGSFDVVHRDPFDRMLAAQSEHEQLDLVTKDPAFAQFGTVTLW